MIHYLKIKNFGPIKEEMEINFEVADTNGIDDYVVEMPDKRKLLKLIYIYGANASGKTTILRAFEFLRSLLLHPNIEKDYTFDYEPFLFRDSPYHLRSSLEFAFYANDIRYVYFLEFTKRSIVSEKLVFYQTQKSTEIYSRSTDLKKRLSSIQFGSKIKVPVRERDLLESNTLHNNTVLGAYVKTNVDIPELEVLNKFFTAFFVGMITSNSMADLFTASLIEAVPGANIWINKLLSKADSQLAEVKVSDMKLGYQTNAEGKPYKVSNLWDHVRGDVVHEQRFEQPVSYEISFVHKVSDTKSFTLSFENESSGTKKYFGLAGPLYHLVHYSRFLSIDELENSLHPDLMKYYLQVFLVNAKKSQLLITTHTTSLMDNEDFIRRDALWFCEKQASGGINLYSAADFDTSTLRKDSNIQKAYKAGKLGGKPNLGSPYLEPIGK